MERHGLSQRHRALLSALRRLTDARLPLLAVPPRTYRIHKCTVALFALRFGVDQHGRDQRRLLALVDPRVICPALHNDVERLEIDFALVE
jgi:hypothetical protein